MMIWWDAAGAVFWWLEGIFDLAAAVGDIEDDEVEWLFDENGDDKGRKEGGVDDDDGDYYYIDYYG